MDNMRKIMQSLVVTGAMSLITMGFSSPAHALLFTDFVDFGPGNSSQTINDSDSAATRSWTHDITDNIGGNPIGNINILTATLAFRYKETDTSEHWFLDQGLGNLALTGSSDVTTNFPLGASALADLQADGLITFLASEDTAGNDSFKRFDATLSGTYELKQNGNGPAIPEPATASLVGLGLTGLALLNKKRRGLPCFTKSASLLN